MVGKAPCYRFLEALCFNFLILALEYGVTSNRIEYVLIEVYGTYIV